jgi:hypothetical protein
VSKEAERVYLTNKMKARADELGFPISYPNHQFNIPVNETYGEFHIMSGPKPIIVGGEGSGRVRVRYVGMVQLTVYVPKDKGTKKAALAQDVFKEIFQFKLGRDAEQSSYKFGVLQDYNPETTSGWECYVVRVSFHRDSIETVQISE